MEQRLRRTFAAVAGLPRGAPAHPAHPSVPDRNDRLHPLRRTGVIVLSVAAIAAIVSLLVVYGPHNSRRPARHTSPAGHPVTGTAPTPSSTAAPAPTTTTTAPPATTTTVAGPSADTQQITYQAFVGSQVNPTLHVTGQQSGACYEYGGGAEPRDYYRCGTMQPCFAGPQGTNAPLVCPQSPVTSGEVITWTATSVDTTMVPATSRTPWAMQLSDGDVCTLVNAAWSGLGPYGCAGAPFADCRAPQAAVPLWTSDCQAQLTATSPFGSTTVEKVWF
jgi:hypothetical protein